MPELLVNKARNLGLLRPWNVDSLKNDKIIAFARNWPFYQICHFIGIYNNVVVLFCFLPVYHQLLIVSQRFGFSTFLLRDELTTPIHSPKGQPGNGQQMLTLLFSLLQVETLVFYATQKLSKHIFISFRSAYNPYEFSESTSYLCPKSSCTSGSCGRSIPATCPSMVPAPNSGRKVLLLQQYN